jgi:transposase
MDDATLRSEHHFFALGIDVGKDSLELALLTPQNELRKKSVRNSASGFKVLMNWLNRWAGPVEGDPASPGVRACLEASGGYEEAAALFLHEQGVYVSVVNPRQTKSYAGVRLQRSKTDPADAALLARYCQREEPPAWEPPTEAERRLRQLTRGLQSLKDERDRTRNKRDRAENETVTAALDAVLDTLSDQIGTLERRIETYVAQNAELKRQTDLLVTIPGIGSQTAATVLAELGDVTRFESARAVAAFAGLTPSHHSSGTSVRRRTRLSKLGNGRLRKALFFPAMVAMRHNEVVRTFAGRLLDRGKAKMAVVGASMRKLLHICYGVLRNGQAFNPSLHIAS